MSPTRHAGSIAPILADGSGTISVLIPAGVQDGDIGLIIWTTYTTAQTNAAATGWTRNQQIGRGSSGSNLVTLWKVMSASDSGTTVTITGASSSSAYVPVATEFWGNVKTPITFTFALASTYGSINSATAVKGSIPLYMWGGYDNIASTPPSSITPPAGWTGGYTAHVASNSEKGLGVWYGPAVVGTTAPGGTVSGPNNLNAISGVIVLPPLITNAYIAGAMAASDTLCTVILAGANAGADTTLLWTP